MSSLISKTDSYKLTHWKQYPPDTTRVYSFFESRGGEFPAVTFFGLQYILLKHLVGQVVTEFHIEEDEWLARLHFGRHGLFNHAGWQRIVEVHKGRLPVRIRAVPEGMTVPASNVLMTVENTDPELPWLTNYLETLLCQVWYPTTVCTQSRAMKADILKFLRVSGKPEDVDFKLHDFGYRGSTSDESAAIGGAAHLVNFKGTDTLAGIRMARQYYNSDVCGFSIPAAEHSTITSWGGPAGEADAYENMLTQFPTGLVAVVSDSYDVYNACKNIWGHALKEQVLARDGVLVVRPDSGDPPQVVLKVLRALSGAFGATTNAKGYAVLNPKIRVIQGDGIDRAMLRKILDAMEVAGWSADNIAFGSGGGLLQKVNRDTCRFAFKCSAIERNGVWHDVWKDPVTDRGKKSKRGRLELFHTYGGAIVTGAEGPAGVGYTALLETVFENGELVRRQSFDDVRARAAVGL